MAGFERDLLVDPSWLAEHLDDDDVVIVDCPWDGDVWGAGNGGAYSRAHVPGAVCQTRHPYLKGSSSEGLSMFLPSEAEVSELAAELGISPNSTVVAYDDWGSIFAARLWWVFRYYGHRGVRVLDGGWQAWIGQGLPISVRAGVANRPGESFVPRADPRRLATLEQVRARYDDADWQIIDTRSQDEWDGTALHGNRRGGHVPGALHVEWNRLLTNSTDFYAVREFRSPDEIRSILEEAGVDGAKGHIPHCQAAVRGAFMGFALELAGYGPAAVYDGSMAEWANRDDSPLEA